MPSKIQENSEETREKKEEGNESDESSIYPEDFDDESIVVEKPASFFSFYNFVKMVMSFLMNNFFKDITVLGAHNVPKRGPVILCGNH